MSDKRTGTGLRRTIKMIALILLLILLLVMFTQAAEALQVPQALKNIGAALTPVENRPGLIDYLVYFTLFTALAYLGFSRWFSGGEGAARGAGGGERAAVIALSAALGVALTVAIVNGAGFNLARLAPVAVMIIGFLMFIGFVALFRSIFGKGVWRTILAIILALLVTFLIIYFAKAMICQNNACNTNPFLKKMFGSESIFGKISNWTGIGLSETEKAAVAVGQTAEDSYNALVDLSKTGYKDASDWWARTKLWDDAVKKLKDLANQIPGIESSKVNSIEDDFTKRIKGK